MIVPLGSAANEPDLAISEEGIMVSDTSLEIGETITIYAKVENFGSQAEAIVRFYEGNPRTFIGEDEITISDDSSALAKISWEPLSDNHMFIVSIEDVYPQDVNLNNNEAMSIFNLDNQENEMSISPHEAMVESGIERVIPVEVEAISDINDIDLNVIYNGDLDIAVLTPPHSIKANEVTKFYLNVKVPHLKNDQNNDNRTILIQACGENVKSNIGELKISVHASFEEGDWWYPSVAVAAGTMGVLAVLGSSEVGKYKLISFVGPLYTKLTREEILDHYTRGKIHGYVLANPGEHYNSIRKALGIPNGSFAYHLQVLERECMIKSKRDGLYKRFYPFGAKIPEGKKFRLNDTQKIILGGISERPGISQGDIAHLLGVKPSTVNYHMKRLQTAGLVNSVRKGISVKYYLSQ
jgi:predicted transcriptional regulator